MYLIQILRMDAELYAPFTYIGSEKKDYRYPMTVSTPHGQKYEVILKGAIDRMDLKDGITRIVDYKTGNSVRGNKLVFPSVEDFFSEDGNGSKEAFQVMLYCLLLEHANPEGLTQLHLNEMPKRVVPHLYFVRDFHSSRKTSTVLKVKQDKNLQELEGFAPYRDEFQLRLISLFQEIYDPKIPFTQCKDTKPCEWCAFANLCNRI